MIEKCKVDIPVTVEYQVHRGEKETGTHDHVEIRKMNIAGLQLPFVFESAVLKAYRDTIEDECFFASGNTSCASAPEPPPEG